MNKILPNCEQVSQLASLSLDEKLTFRQKLGIHIHLMFCQWCRHFNNQLTQINSAINQESANIINDSSKSDIKMTDDFKVKLKKTIENNK